MWLTIILHKIITYVNIFMLYQVHYLHHDYNTEIIQLF